MESHRHQPFLLVMSFVQAHTALFNNDLFRHHSVHGRYGDNLEEMDWSVGEVLKSLKKLGLENNTFVYLTSDNGGHVEEFTDDGEREGGWNGIFKGNAVYQFAMCKLSSFSFSIFGLFDFVNASNYNPSHKVFQSSL